MGGCGWVGWLGGLVGEDGRWLIHGLEIQA